MLSKAVSAVVHSIDAHLAEAEVDAGSTKMPATTRRSFLGRSLVLAGGTLLANSVFRDSAGAEEQQPMGDDLISRMSWLNEPASWKRSESSVIVRCKPKTDFWRKTFYGYVTDSGHFLHLAVSGSFAFEARINGQYATLYDQAGLMVRVDAENWVKCGTEFVDGVRHASVVFTREFSDWSSMNDLSQNGPVWWKVVRTRDALEALCSVDGEKYSSIRQGYLVPADKAAVGIMCAAPEGNGFECVFDKMKLVHTSS